MDSSSEDEYGYDGDYSVRSPIELVVNMRDVIRFNLDSAITLSPRKDNGGSIPVRKIFVNNVSHCTSREELKTYFGKHGRIVSIDTPREIDGKTRKNYVFITYFNPQDAEKVINMKTVKLNSKKLYINAADQWHQPLELPGGKIQWFRGAESSQQSFYCNSAVNGITDYSDQGSTSNAFPDPPTETENSNEPCINNILNDDCLVHIFSFLSKWELIGIERVCKRWQEICLGLWCKETSLDFKNVFRIKPGVRLHTDYFRELLLRCGNHITALDISDRSLELNASRVLQLISKHCKSLNYLNISRLTILKHSLNVFTANIAPQLKNLQMNKCSGLNNYFLDSILIKSPELDVLSVARTSVSHEGFRSLSNKCRTLNINCCTRIKNKGMMTMFNNLPNLKKLSARNTNARLNVCMILGQSLVSLDVSGCSFSLDPGSSTSTPLFPHLQTLICGHCASINDKALRAIVVECPLLEKLDISGCGSYSVARGEMYSVTDKGVCELSKLKKLSSLYLNSLESISSSCLEYLAANTKNRLRNIECRRCSSITDSGPSRLVTLCSDLEYLDVRDCITITSSVVNAALDAVKLRTNQRVLTLCVTGTGVICSAEMEPHPLLNLSFSPAPFNNAFTRDIFIDPLSSDEEFMDEIDAAGRRAEIWTSIILRSYVGRTSLYL